MCIFCKIAAKEIPAQILYEDQEVMAILDISAATYGHCLVLPKAHYANILETPAELRHQLIDVAVNISELLIEKLNADGCNILSNTNEAAGQTVFHTHLHLLPRYTNDDLQIQFTAHPYNLEELRQKILDL